MVESYINFLRDIFTCQEFWISAFAVFSVLFICGAVSSLLSWKSVVTPGKIYRLRYNVFVDRYTLNGKLISKEQIIVVCVACNDPNGSRCRFVPAYLKPTFLDWGLYDADTDERIDAKISGLYACFPGEVSHD